MTTIQTYLRLKPTNNSTKTHISLSPSTPNTLNFHIPKNATLTVNNTRENYTYGFEGILGGEVGQEEVFDVIGRPVVNSALSGYNATIFAYGQTGSGKTFTITGGSTRYVDRGIIPRAITLLFKEFADRAGGEGGVAWRAFVSYLEIYNENGYDLLDGEHDTTRIENKKKVTMMEDEDGNYHLKNLSLHPVSSEEDALNCLFLGDTNRAISETEMNAASSRSHCIFTISLEGRPNGSDTVIRSKLHLVDLAGSERVHKTSNSGQTLKEATYINSSLFYLEMVIVALQEKSNPKLKNKRSHIPYRNSMMTSVLRDSLGGNCKTVMIATVSPDYMCTDESISTCNFAQRVALIKNVAQINEDVDPTTVIRRLKTELANLREEVKFLSGEAGEGYELSDTQRADLGKLVCEYVDDLDVNCVLNIGTMTVVKIRDVHAIFKNLVLDARHDNNANAQARGGGGGGSNEENEKIVTTLKKSLVQRDNEIAILVNMVKQGKRLPGSAGGFGTGQMNASDVKPPPPASSASSAAEDKEAASQRRINALSERTISGVKLTTDPKIIEDAAAAFNFFKGVYPGISAMEDNKVLLKTKYGDAKVTGENVNRSRNAINYLKGTIEQLRRERAMERVGESKGLEEEANIDVLEEEVQHRQQIEVEKATYKLNFATLRSLKNEIEHIQRLLEKGRNKMQSDFDLWYKGCLDFQFRYGDKGQGQVGGNGGSNGYDSIPSTPGYSTMPLSPPSSSSTLNVSQPKSQMNNSDSVSRVTQAKLTGNKEADDDILAFYKAKEEMVRRNGGGGRAQAKG